MLSKKRVIIGLVGTVLDRGDGPKRWENWRPTVSLCQHEDLLVDRLELIYGKRFTRTAENLVADINSVSPETAIGRHVLEFEDPWDFQEVYGALADFAGNYDFHPEHEEYLIHITTGTHVAQICLFLLCESQRIPGKLIQSAPPGDRDYDSAGKYSIIDLDLSRYDRLATRFVEEKQEARTFLKSGIATRNPAFNRMIEEIEHVALASKEPILFMGPTGAGKSSLARKVFELKKQRHQLRGDFIEVNCATLRGDTAMSTLFGHIRGSFTGAQRDRAGLLRSADGGLLFLDEIGELGTDEQAMLLRALEEKRFLPVGSDREISSDFQLIAGTNCDLAGNVRNGKFREDLLARINLWTFQLPGLAQRLEDLEPNLDYELASAGKRLGRRITLSREVRDAFLVFSKSGEAKWSANFRDLNAAVTRMSTLAPSGRITSEVLQSEIVRLRQAWQNAPKTDTDENSLATIFTSEEISQIDLFDRAQLVCVIRICLSSDTLSEAGRQLFAISRSGRKTANDADRLRKYLSRFNLTWQIIKAARNEQCKI